MKFTLKALSLALVASTSTVTFADAAPTLALGLEFSGSAAITTDYRFRGLTQTENDPAVQLGFQLDHASGLYAGVWGSNVNYKYEDKNGLEQTVHLEVDPYIGYAKTFENVAGKPTLDVGVYYYIYPGHGDNNFLEYYAGVGFESLVAKDDSVSTYVYYTDDNLGTGDDAWYLNASYSVPFGSSFGGVVAVGFTDVKAVDADHVWDWKAGITYDFQSIDGLSAELAAVGTNTDTNGYTSLQKRGVETGAVFTLAKSF